MTYYHAAILAIHIILSRYNYSATFYLTVNCLKHGQTLYYI